MADNYSFGKRFGSWITLIVLTAIAVVVVAVVYTILTLIVRATGTFPEFIATVLFYLYWPLLLLGVFGPVFGLVSWASNCSESICPTKKGGRYIVLLFYFIITFIANIISLYNGKSFNVIMIFPLIFVWAFWNQYQEFKD